jgi:hypothetical protein
MYNYGKMSRGQQRRKDDVKKERLDESYRRSGVQADRVEAEASHARDGDVWP